MIIVLLSCFGAYNYYSGPSLEECRAHVNRNYIVPGAKIESSLFYTIIPSGHNELTFLINGRIFKGESKFEVSRVLVFNYEYYQNQFFMNLKSAAVGSFDNVKDDSLNSYLPPRWKSSHLRIERVDDQHYLFYDNHSPILVCTIR